VDVVKMPLQEAVNRVLDGEIPDGKTALALLMARDRLRTCREVLSRPTNM